MRDQTLHPKLPKISSTFGIFFLEVLGVYSKNSSKWQIFFKGIEFHESHHVLPFFSFVS
jgi:hypothetical protein